MNKQQSKHLIIVEGNEGSGKSWFCSTLEHLLYMDQDKPKFISTGAITPDTPISRAVRARLIERGETSGELLDSLHMLQGIESNFFDHILKAFNNDTDVVIMDRGLLSFQVRNLMLASKKNSDILTPVFARFLQSYKRELLTRYVKCTTVFIDNTVENCLTNIAKRNKSNVLNDRHKERMVDVDGATRQLITDMGTAPNLFNSVVSFKNYTGKEPVAKGIDSIAFVGSIIQRIKEH